MALVLVFMALATLVVPPVLSYVGTGFKTGMIFEDNTRQIYAAESGINDGIWYARYDNFSTVFGSSYQEYDFQSSWNYTLEAPVNGYEVNVEVDNVWLPSNIAAPGDLEARTIIENGLLMLSGGAPPESSTYQLRLSFFTDGINEPAIETLGVWLPPGFSYVEGSSNLEEDSGASYYPHSVEVFPHASGEAVLWHFWSVPIEEFGPDVSSEGASIISTITFDYTAQEPDQRPAAVSWVTTSGAPDVPFTWDADTRIFHITGRAGEACVEIYVGKSEVRELDSAVNGDYLAIGNTLMTTTWNERYRDRLFSESNAIVAENDLPDTATIQSARLYWSGWIDNIHEVDIFSDAVSDIVIEEQQSIGWIIGADWDVHDGEFRGHHDSDHEETDRYLQMDYSVDLSAYQGTEVKISWEQSSGGWLEFEDRLRYSFSANDGVTWSSMSTAFQGGASVNDFSGTIPDGFLTDGFRLRFYLDGFNGSDYFGDECAYIDNIRIFKEDFGVNRVMFNGQEIVADRQQVDQNAGSTYSYSCFYDATGLINTMIDNGQLGMNGSGTYTLGHVLRTRPDDPGYSVSLYPSGSTGYPLGIPNTSTGYREWAYAGWSLILIYTSPETVGHQLYLYDDFTYVGGGDTVNLPITGFLTPPNPAGSRLTCFVGEGDPFYTGDYVSLNDNVLSDGVNPANNIFNSYSNTLDNPNINGIDLDTFDISAYVQAGDTSAAFETGTPLDVYNIIYIILSFRHDATFGGTVSYLIRS